MNSYLVKMTLSSIVCPKCFWEMVQSGSWFLPMRSTRRAYLCLWYFFIKISKWVIKIGIFSAIALSFLVMSRRWHFGDIRGMVLVFLIKVSFHSPMMSTKGSQVQTFFRKSLKWSVSFMWWFLWHDEASCDKALVEDHLEGGWTW